MYTVSVTHILLSVVLCHYAHCCLLKHLHCLSGSHTEPPVGYVSPYSLLSSAVCPLLFAAVCPMLVAINIQSLGSMPLYPLLNSTDCLLSVSTSHFTECWSCITVFTASTSQYTVSCFCVSVPTFAPTVSPLSVSTSHFTACWFCVTVSTAVFCSQSTAVFYSLSTVSTSQYMVS
jgi:hypothetical protein